MPTPINGTAGNDLLVGGNGNDILDGGAGSDQLYGGAGDDTYIWDPVSGGRDWLADEEGIDTLHIDALPSALTLSTTLNGNSLRIQFGHTAHLDIAQYFDTSVTGAHIEKIVFADGTVWTRQQVIAALTGPLLPEENFAPEIIRLDGGRVMEGSATVDPVVGWIRAHDENGDALTYTLVNNAGGRFYMEGNAIRVADWSLIDHETGPSHEVRVRVTDTAGASTEQAFWITVLNREDEPAPPPPPPPPPENRTPTVIFTPNTISEDSPAGANAGTFSIADPDGDAVFIELTNNADGIFALEGNRLLVVDPSRLNAETDHQINVRVTDSRGAIVLQHIEIDVVEGETPPPPPNRAPNDLWLHAPDIPEGATGGYVVGQIFGFDPDGDPLTYTIPTDDSGPLIIQGDKIVLRDGVILEGGSPIRFSLKASDGRGGNLVREFSINVIDAPENPPPPPPPPPENQAPTVVFNGREISEDSPVGAEVGTFEITDPDGDAVSIEITDSANGIFAISGNRLLVADPTRLDAETDHEVRILVKDSRGAAVTEIITVDVAESEGENPPPPPPPENHAPSDIILSDTSVAENSENGTVVSLLIGRDEDAGDTLTYTLLDSAEGRFAIIGDELVVTDGTRLDHEAAASHSIKVQVTDSQGASIVRSFAIQVEDELDETAPGSGENDTIIGGVGEDDLSGGGGKDVLTGGAGNDTLDGGAGADRLFGGKGKDVLSGGGGKDVLTGGSGKDVFVFDTKPSRSNVDRITDFSVRDDTIHLAKAVFKAAGRKGKLSEDAFWIGSTAHDESDRIIYNARNGKLYYDADGTGDKAAVQIAILGKNLTAMSHTDFLII